MSRSGYTDDGEYLELWRGTVNRALRGKRGQAFLREMLTALDALPEKVLIAEEIADSDGNVCALGSVARLRGMDIGRLDPEYPDELARAFGIATAMTQEIEYVNDEYWDHRITPQERFEKVRAWVVRNIIPDASLTGD